MAHGPERFTGRILGVATLHGKEEVIGPALCGRLPIAGYRAINGADTDRFGAFSGEVKRVLDPIEACKAKARHGAAVSGLDLVIASEGSFFPYPPAPFMACDEEVLVLFDVREDRFFEHRHLSLHTVFGAEECGSWQQVSAFAERMKFPHHGLVVRAKEHWSAGEVMRKGITGFDDLRDLVERLIAQHGACWVETDMRAMMNPTRMSVIGEAADRFAEELATTCPACGACWFRRTAEVAGLPCALCGQPTNAIKGHWLTCHVCAHQRILPRPDGRSAEDPRFCDHCNP